ncbi:hypothetical protein LZG00_19195 [Rhodobacteraceae bacterium LMO-12]|nr:hypothetical protein [Rhodobacteraceae bacterium LMO-JJ12]
MEKDQITAGAERLGKAIVTVERQLKMLAREMAVMHGQIRAGNACELKDAKRVAEDIRQWLGIAYELEKRLEKSGHDRREHNAPKSIDLDSARHQIGCRLDRLRATRCPGRFSQRSE